LFVISVNSASSQSLHGPAGQVKKHQTLQFEELIDLWEAHKMITLYIVSFYFLMEVVWKVYMINMFNISFEIHFSEASE
jgi:hypothetical protein